jgi:Dynein light chain type 1
LELIHKHKHYLRIPKIKRNLNSAPVE